MTYIDINEDYWVFLISTRYWKLELFNRFTHVYFMFFHFSIIVNLNLYFWFTFQFVSTMFWGLYFLDRNLIMPKYLDVYFPSWLNHTMHTFVSVFACLEMITAYRPYPSRVHGLGIHLGFQLIYLVWWVYLYRY